MATVPMLNSDVVALIDAADVRLVSEYRWFTYKIGRTYYAMAMHGDRQRIYMHRLLAGEPGMEVDHRNGDGLDNRRSNLRVTTHRLNLANQRPQIGRSSQFKGVSWSKARRKWGNDVVDSPKWGVPR